jgi:signal transduction histidine kinase
MKPNIRHLLGFFLIILSTPCFSQGKKINLDSLINVYQKYPKDDTIKLSMLIKIIPEIKNKNVQKALLYADTAMVLADKIGHPYFKAHSLSKKGEILIANGNYTDAEKALEASLAIFIKLKRPVAQGDVYTSLGIVSQNRKENNAAMDYYKKAEKIYYDYKLDDLVIQVQDKMASLFGLMGNPEKAIELKNKIISYYQKTKNKTALAQTWGSKSRYHYLSGEIPMALECIFTSLKINEEMGDLRAQLYNYQNLSVLYGEINNPQKAIEYAEKGIKLNQIVKNKKLEIGLKNAICVAYAKLSDQKNAIKCYTEVVKSFESIGNETAAAETYGLLAGHLLDDKQYYNAFTTYQKLLKFYEKSNNQITIPQELYRIGDLIMMMPDSSLQNLNIPLIDRYKESMIYLQKGLHMARTQKNLLQQAAILTAISKNFEAQNNYTEAYKAFKEYTSLKDSISGDEVQKKLNRSEIQYEYDKKELALKYEKQLTDKQLANQLLLTTQQKQALRLNEQALTLSNQEKDLTHLAFLKEQAEKQEKTQQLALAEEREKTKEQDLSLKNIQLSTQKKQNLYLGSFIFVLLFGLGTLIYFYQILKKQKNIISQQNQLNEQTISVLSHDIKEPLLGVKLLLKKLHVHDPFLSQASQSLENQVHAVNGVLNNLLRMRKAAITETTTNQNANVNDIIHNVIKDLTFNLESKGLIVENQLKDHVTLPIAPEKLQIVIHNILSNAIKYSHPDQSIKIYKDGNGFCIQDFGIGLSDIQTQNLMSDVKNSKPGTTEEKGHGMGLFLVGMLLKGEQVRVIFESPELGGTIVKIMG